MAKKLVTVYELAVYRNGLDNMATSSLEFATRKEAGEAFTAYKKQNVSVLLSRMVYDCTEADLAHADLVGCYELREFEATNGGNVSRETFYNVKN